VAFTRSSPDRYRVHVANVTGPFILVFSDAYAPGWKLEGLHGRDSATHIQIDGYRNGWAVDAAGDLDLTLSYAPARASHWARLVSIATLLVLLALLPFAPFATGMRRRVRARRVRSQHSGPRRIALPESWVLPSE
jgi:hypothetical protein